jgi:hypothetical protein
MAKMRAMTTTSHKNNKCISMATVCCHWHSLVAEASAIIGKATTKKANHYNNEEKQQKSKHEISRSLLESFPNTRLARMASNTWQMDPEGAMFFDHNGE